MRIELILANWQMFANGVWMTLQLTFLPLALGFLIALPAGLARARGAPFWSGAINAYVYLFRGTPLLVQTFLIYYGLRSSTGCARAGPGCSCASPGGAR